MSKEIITARDPEIIAAEINTIKRQVQETVIYGTIRIGEKLCEAKSMVPQGEWGKWLEENVEYSQSTAENLMKLYREYGGNQESLFDTWTNSQTFGKLSYTQHLALLALPFAERQEFAEENNVQEMSTRELQQAIRERDQARMEAEAYEAQARDAAQNVLDMQQQLAAAKSSEGAWQEQIDKLTADRDKAEIGEENARKEVEKLEAALKKAKADAEDAKKKAKEAKENPKIPESMMEQLRREAEEAAAKKSAGDLQKQLEEARADLAAQQKKTAAIEEKLVAVQKKADPEMVECNVMAQKVRADFNSLVGWVKKVSVGDKEKGEKMLKFLRLLVKAWAEALGMRVSEE